MGVDFGINTYDEDFAVMVFPDGLDRPYNAIIILDRVIYDGSIKEVQNDTFGYFKFLGVFDS